MSSAELGALDRLELELRKIPEVLAVGFEGSSEGSSITSDAQGFPSVAEINNAADLGNSPLSITEIPQLIARVGCR